MDNSFNRDTGLGLSGQHHRASQPLSGVRLLALGAMLVLASCAVPKKHVDALSPKHINNKTKFSSTIFGVKGSPRVTTSRKVRKGGGRYQVGKPYKIRGKWYYPKDEPGYDKSGMASWYGPNFHGRLTANGEIYDQYGLSAAHPTLPLPSYARVTNLENGSSVIVRINDRGPFSEKRIIDMSARASELLGFQNKGLAKVRVQYIGRARMDGLDEKYLMASYKPNGGPLRNRGIFQRLPTLFAGAKKPATVLAGIQTPRSNVPSSTNSAPIPSGELNPALTSRTQIAYISPPQSTPVSFATAFIPVPLLRPTPLYEGYSLNLTSEYSTTGFLREPLGYLQTNTYNMRISRAFSAIENNQSGPDRHP